MAKATNSEPTRSLALLSMRNIVFVKTKE